MSTQDLCLPVVSIIINNYNYEKYLSEAIDSALNQTYKHVEIIIVDDGSTDKSKEIIQHYSLKKTFFKSNGGQVSALNLGFKHCEGDIVIFLDSDDFLSSDACEILANNYEDSINAYQYYLKVVDEDSLIHGGRLPERFINNIPFQDFVLNFGYVPTAPMSGVAYSRRFLATQFPFDETVWNNAVDGYLIYVAAVYDEIKIINNELGFYRVHSKSESEHYFVSLKKSRQMLKAQEMYADGIQSAERELFHENKSIKNFLLGPYHWRNRLDSFVLDNVNHDFPQDTKNFITKNIIANFYRAPEVSFLKKIKNLMFYIFILIFPVKVSAKLIGCFNKYPDL
ncbi:glycosyltransferase family 2 protein [Shewanella gaetbuli]|uniref:Glycosyltransferase n=1 Tax=Shewanella gaetbuli TaxID=220752 RepID=A0A9X2CIP9_9GAMM|nr:glycosyltransferase [Shewanella gaetbuli]MCL1143252.1 glycosyltransferase [Shewanella gaetbuli]